MVTQAQWSKYKSIINNAHDSFNQDEITWYRKVSGLDRFGEDDSDDHTPVVLKCLNAFNYFRTWPMTDESISGKIDKESMVVLLNNKYLLDSGYLNDNGNFDFDPGTDYFEFHGQKLTSSGETPLSQAGDEPLLTMLILKREPTDTGSNKY